MLALIACSALLVLDDPTPPPPEPRDYAEARRQAGPTPEAQVRLALWCESRGLAAERLRHLAMAVMADPANAAARGLMGLVSRDGRWLRPEAVAEEAGADPALAATLAEYDGRRQKAAYKADAQLELGVWCEEHGLKDQAKAHLTAVVRLDPTRDAAWRHLGYKKHDGRWVTDAQLAAERAEAEAQKAADRHWKPILEKWKAQLAQPSRREDALASLSGVTDPRAVPSIGRAFGAAEADQPIAIRLLGQIDSRASSRGLATLALVAKSGESRRAAAETLRRRDAREYADLLIALIRDPIRFHVRPSAGPGSTGTLLIEGKRANLQRNYTSTGAYQPGDTVGFDRNGQPVLRHYLYNEAYWTGYIAPNPRSKILGEIDTYNDSFSGMGNPGAGVFNGSLSSTPGLTYQAPAPGAAAAQANRVGQARHLLGNGAAASRIMAGAANMVPPGFSFNGGTQGPYRSPASVSLPQGNSQDFARSVVAEIPLERAIVESRRSAYVSEQQLQADVATLDASNRATRDLNDRAVAVLNGATGAGLPPERAAWDKWWVDQLGYAFMTGQTTTAPTIVEVVPSGYQGDLTPTNVITQTAVRSRMSCFGAGTPVLTIDGPRPIESLKVGDRVLTQGMATGALGYRPILVVHHNPPAPTYRIGLGGDSIISSHFHRFWVAGKGWVMARDLKPGDPVRTLGAVRAVESVEPDKVQLVYNLDVSEDADFFAGKAAALVHDNTLPDPRLAPFDAVAASRPAADR